MQILRTFLATYAVSVLLFFVTSRYRVPMVPVAMIFAAAALHEGFFFIRMQQWRRLAVPGAALILLLVALNVQSAPPVEQDAQFHHDLGEVLLRKEQFATSAQYSQQALKLEPEYPSAWHNLAVALLASGDPVQAESACRQALAQYPSRADTRIVLARSLFTLRRSAEARAELEKAATQEPENGEVRYAAGRLLLRAGQTTEALHHLQVAARL